jgi:FtsP/CotA-like multicopper oxidase with cupredoxin domain
MNIRKSWLYVSLSALIVSAGGISACASNQHTSTQVTAPLAQAPGPNGQYKSVADYVAQADPGVKVDKFTLDAEQKTLTLAPGKTVNAMTFNGTAPGPLLTVKQGDMVEVTVHNHLKVPITIHWHGIAVPGAEDGVPGLTQAPIKPGATYVYRFIAKDPGTYWYHSHDNSVEEIGEGLYGGLVVLPKNQSTPAPDKDCTLLLHEWSTSTSSNDGMSGMDMGNMSGMNMNGMDDMGSMNMSVPNLRTNGFQVISLDRSAVNEMSNMYDAYTINGTASGKTMLEAKPGQIVRLRLVNAGNMTHLMTLVGTSFKVIAMDGQDISNPTPIENQLLPIGAGERYDVEFTMPSGNVQLVSADPNMTEQMQLRATIGDTTDSNVGSMSDMPNVQNEPWFDFTHYGSGTSTGQQTFSLNQKFDKTFNMDLGVAMNKSGMVYTINGKEFPNVPPFVVNTGDTVKIHIENKSAYIHPMHLHGHDFQVLTRDGKPVTGSPIYLDTLEVLPGETYDIAFKADNPGLWMFHCHDLHHAASGMDVILQYSGVSDPYNMKDMSE